MTPKKGWQERFLKALTERTALVTRAAQIAGISREHAYLYRQKDPEFAAKWDELIEARTDDVEDAGERKAIEDLDTTMIIFLLKTRRRKVYGENPLDGADAPPAITVSFNGRPNAG